MLQTLPHDPQFLGSPAVLTSQPFAALLSQSANPIAQPSTVHIALVQPGVTLFPPHTLPQAPQFLGSPCWVLVHLLEQQESPLPHSAPHAPQCEGELTVSTQPRSQHLPPTPNFTPHSASP